MEEQAISSVAQNPEESITLLQLLIKGGWVMLILLILSIFTIYLFFERWLVIKNSALPTQSFFKQLKQAIYDGNLKEAKKICKVQESPISRVLNAALDRIGAPIQNIESSIANSAQIELYKLEKNISMLSTISGVAPMIGFFGTIIGMINAFIAISQQETAVSPKLLSSGIYEAMITTAGGLFVGIIAYLAYNYLVKKVQDMSHQLELAANDFMNLLQKTD